MTGRIAAVLHTAYHNKHQLLLSMQDSSGATPRAKAASCSTLMGAMQQQSPVDVVQSQHFNS
jgi:hypothetical protein